MTLTIMRGLPGSGKSTLARQIAKETGAVIVSTDDYFMVDGKYCFDEARLGPAHVDCQQRAWQALADGFNAIVDNCNIKRAHYKPYLEIAARREATVVFAVGPLNGKPLDFLFYNNSHQVPMHILEKMRGEWTEVSNS